MQLIAGGPQAKPTEQHQPNTAEGAATQQQKYAQNNCCPSQQLTAVGGHPHPPHAAASELPHQGLNNLAAIEGQAGKQVEQSQHQVQLGQFLGHQPSNWQQMAERMHCQG